MVITYVGNYKYQSFVAGARKAIYLDRDAVPLSVVISGVRLAWAENMTMVVVVENREQSPHGALLPRTSARALYVSWT